MRFIYLFTYDVRAYICVFVCSTQFHHHNQHVDCFLCHLCFVRKNVNIEWFRCGFSRSHIMNNNNFYICFFHFTRYPASYVFTSYDIQIVFVAFFFFSFFLSSHLVAGDISITNHSIWINCVKKRLTIFDLLTFISSNDFHSNSSINSDFHKLRKYNDRIRLIYPIYNCEMIKFVSINLSSP